ncbi:MAG: hypothetical protein ACI9EW_001895 [Cellvibrionaceae bacterium]|jgi:hypothetical protein
MFFRRVIYYGGLICVLGMKQKKQGHPYWMTLLYTESFWLILKSTESWILTVGPAARELKQVLNMVP